MLFFKSIHNCWADFFRTGAQFDRIHALCDELLSAIRNMFVFLHTGMAQVVEIISCRTKGLFTVNNKDGDALVPSIIIQGTMAPKQL